jgi:hypothetical protein
MVHQKVYDQRKQHTTYLVNSLLDIMESLLIGLNIVILQV